LCREFRNDDNVEKLTTVGGKLFQTFATLPLKKFFRTLLAMRTKIGYVVRCRVTLVVLWCAVTVITGYCTAQSVGVPLKVAPSPTDRRSTPECRPTSTGSRRPSTKTPWQVALCDCVWHTSSRSSDAFLQTAVLRLLC